jgi:molecular chaperone IbpA
MTALDLINKFNKDVWDNSDKMFGDVFDNVKYGKGEYGIELGLAGFNKKNVKVQYKDGVLTVSGQVDDSEKEYLEKGLAARKFFKQFALHDKAVVNDASMEDGVLTIKLGVNEPEEIKPLDIKIK